MGIRHTAASVVLLLIAALAVVAGVGAPAAQGAVTPVANPQIEEKCGLPITLVLDASGSIQSSGAVNKVRDAAEAFLDALSNTNSSVRVTQFASLTQQLAPSTVVDDNSLGAGGALRRAIDGYYNPRPPRPANVDLWQFSNGAFKVNNGSSSDQYTNWDASLRQAAETPATPAVPGPRGLHHRRGPDGVRLRQAGRQGRPWTSPGRRVRHRLDHRPGPDHPRPGGRGSQQRQEPGHADARGRGRHSPQQQRQPEPARSRSRVPRRSRTPTSTTWTASTTSTSHW